MEQMPQDVDFKMRWNYIFDVDDSSQRVEWYCCPDFCGGIGGELWVDWSVDRHRLLPGLFECRHPDG